MPWVDSSKYRGISSLVIAVCMAMSGCQWLFPDSQEIDQKKDARTVYALGHLRPATGVVDILATPGDRLKSLTEGVELNKVIPTNGILGTLDSYDMGQAQLLALEQKKQLALQKYKHQKQLAFAQLAQAKAAKAQALAKQKEIELQEKRLVVLAVAMRLEQTEYQKLEQLWADDPELVTAHQLAKQKNKLDMAIQDFEIANQSYPSTKRAADLSVDATTGSFNVAKLAHDQVDENSFSDQLETKLIEQEIKVAREALKRSVLLAPKYSEDALADLLNVVESVDSLRTTEAGSTTHRVEDDNSTPMPQYIVLKISARDGEIVTQAPIMQLGDLREMICIAEVYESDRKELFDEQEVIIRSPAFSGFFADGPLKKEGTTERWGGIRGRVKEVGRLVSPPGLTSRNPLAPADRSVVEARIAIDVPANQSEIKAAKEARRGNEDNWSEDANAHAAENVGLQVTIEFSKKKTDASSADGAEPVDKNESSASQSGS